MDRLSNKCAEKSVMKPEEYLQEVRVLIASMQDVLSAEEISEVEHLVDHDEPIEGLRTLAWIIHDERKIVSANSVEAILRLIGDAIPKADLPPNFGNEP